MSKSLAPKYFKEQVGVLCVPRTLSEGYLSANDQKLPSTIFPEIRVITAAKRTFNNTYYPEESLIGNEADRTGLISFTSPYGIPVIRDHNSTPGPFGGQASEVYGRIFHPAQFIREAGEGYVRVMATITHPEAIEGILTGRWLTTSLGSRTESVLCSLCRTELTRGMCDHERGEDYDVDGAPAAALWMIGPIRSKELSFVVSPSDDQSGVVTPHNTQFPKESIEGPTAPHSGLLSRILVQNRSGIFDLATGARVEESGFLVPSQVRRHFALGMRRTESPVAPAGFHGAGDYLLGGPDHEHLVVLDDRGYGNSGPGYKSRTDYSQGGPDGTEPRPLPAGGTSETQEPQYLADRHVHDIQDGSPVPGEDNHVHHLIPSDVPDRRDPHESEDAPLTFAQLFRLPGTDPDAGRTAFEASEAVLTAKTRSALPGSAFCGPEKSFPAHDASHVRAGLAYLDRSHLTPDQKSRTKACLIRRGKSMGMDMSGSQKESAASTSQGEKPMFAARLSDTDHRVEIDLYPLPPNHEALETVLVQLRAMPHTEEERRQILERLAGHCRSVLSTAEWQAHFGELALCEAGAPITIPITAENYGLIYSALEICADRSVRREPAPETPATTETPCAPCDDPPAGDPPAETQEAVVTPPSEVTDAAPSAERSLSEALAHSVALYQLALRKPTARGKSLSELIEKLGARSPASLRDTLEDLTAEWGLQDSALPIALPTVADPTQSAPAATAPPVPPEGENAVLPEDPPAFSTSQDTSLLEAGEFAQEEEDLIYLLYPRLKSES